MGEHPPTQVDDRQRDARSAQRARHPFQQVPTKDPGGLQTAAFIQGQPADATQRFRWLHWEDVEKSRQ